ncbi:MAG: universal stress protein [Acidobacteria bacterium]|nr:universal stress protein [Acidobacteriota bacterium]
MTTTVLDQTTGPGRAGDLPHRVLLATDGGLGSTAAIRWLAARARTAPIEVELAEVLDPDAKQDQESGMSSGDRGQDADTATEHARDMLLQLAPHVRVRRVVLHGDPVPELLKRAAEADLLVVGSNRAVRVLPHLAPSFATRVAEGSPIPVVVVPTGWEQVPGPVVLGVEGDGSDDAAIEFAAREAERTGTQLVVVRAWGLVAELVSEGHDMRRRAGEPGSEALLAQVLERVQAAHPQLDPVPMLHHGTPIEVLVNLGRGASLVVVGTHRRADADRMLLRSVSKRVLERPVCAIALVPPA